MSRTPRIRPTGAATAVGLMIGALALAGCGAGQAAQTSRQVSAVGGASAATGAVVIRDASIKFGERVAGRNIYSIGGAAPLQMRIVNSSRTADRLISASSPVAGSVTVSGDVEIAGGQVLVVGGEPVLAPATQPTGRPGSTTIPTTTVGPTGTREAQIVLTGLRVDVVSGLTYPVVLVFERAGEIRFDLPVANPSEPREPAPSG